jgi:hypothetical protein
VLLQLVEKIYVRNVIVSGGEGVVSKLKNSKKRGQQILPFKFMKIKFSNLLSVDLICEKDAVAVNINQGLNTIFVPYLKFDVKLLKLEQTNPNFLILNKSVPKNIEIMEAKNIIYLGNRKFSKKYGNCFKNAENIIDMSSLNYLEVLLKSTNFLIRKGKYEIYRPKNVK